VHTANYRRFEEIGKLIGTGPFLDSFEVSGEVRGMGCSELALTRKPMGKVNRLAFELHAWIINKKISCHESLIQ